MKFEDIFAIFAIIFAMIFLYLNLFFGPVLTIAAYGWAMKTLTGL